MKFNNVEFASKNAAAQRDSSRRYELQVLKDGWMPLVLAGDVSTLHHLVPHLLQHGRDIRIFDWINGETVQA